MKLKVSPQLQQSGFSKNQTQALGFLFLGTFLEYFDLMLYIHMAPLLNEIFFAQSHELSAIALSSFSLFLIYIFRPLGALAFGWIGDHFGRKSTLIITTLLMSTSCMIIANLPTYAQIGVAASWIIVICRTIQSISSMGEKIGAELYLTEITRPPIQYPVVGFLTIASDLGALAALAISSFTITYELNWRIAFWIGASVALVGTGARGFLRETIDFVDAKRSIQNAASDVGIDTKEISVDLNTNFLSRIQVDKKGIVCLFAIFCAWPVWFYFTYVYIANILLTSFNLNTHEIINHNFCVALVQIVSDLLVVGLSYKFHPLIISKIKAYLFLPFLLLLPFLLKNATTQLHLFLLQGILISGPCVSTLMPILIKHFPVLKRFSIMSISYATSRALMYTLILICTLKCNNFTHDYAIHIITIPTLFAYIFGINYFLYIIKKN